MTKTKRRMRRFAMQHILKCGSETEALIDGNVLHQRCRVCHALISIPIRGGCELVHTKTNPDGTAVFDVVEPVVM